MAIALKDFVFTIQQPEIEVMEWKEASRIDLETGLSL